MTDFPMNHRGRYCCAFGTCELCVAAEARDAEFFPAWLAFLAEHGLTREQVFECRTRALAKMREPRQRWRVVVVDNAEPRHHLTPVTPDPVARGIEAFFARYTDDDLGAMLVELVVSWRRRAAHQRWLDTVLPSLPRDEMDAAIGEHMADLADRVTAWREELTGARALRASDAFEEVRRGMGGA